MFHLWLKNCGNIEIQTHHRLRRHGLPRLAGAEDRHGRAGKNRGGVRQNVSEREAHPQFQPHGHRRPRARAWWHTSKFRTRNSKCPSPGSRSRSTLFWPGRYPRAAAARVPEKFHARFDAKGKQYRYFVWNHAAMNPLLQNRAWHFPMKLDLTKMRAAAKLFLGKHDFKSFAGTRSYEMESNVRTLTRL